MQRKEAEKLIAALIFDDLDEASKTELLNYLQTDNELRERLADMRMAVKVASDTVQHGPDPVLGKRRLKRLARLARHGRTRPKIFTMPRLAAAAAIFIIASVGLIGIPSLSKVRRFASSKVVTKYNERDFADIQSHYESPADVPSRGEQATEITPSEGLYTSYNAPPEVVDRIIAMNDENYFAGAKVDFEGITNAQISPLHGEVHSSGRSGSTERWDSASTWESKPHGGTASREDLMETDRKARIEDLMESAMVLQGQMRYEEALGQLESMLVLDPMNNNALIQKQTLEDMVSYRRQIEVERKKSKEGIDVLRKTDLASIPYAGNLTYPDDWKNIIASPYRKPEEPLGQGHYALAPEALRPGAVDSGPVTGLPERVIAGQIQNDDRFFAKAIDEIGGIAGAKISPLHGDVQSFVRAVPTERWDSASSFEGKPHSGMREGGLSCSYESSVDAIDHIISQSPGGGYGGMGRFPGSNMGGGGYGGGNGKTGYYPRGSFSWQGGGNGVMSGDGLYCSYDGDIDFIDKQINLFNTKPDAPGFVADGDSIAGGSRVTFQNGKAVSIKKEGLAIDGFDAYTDKDGGRRPVVIDSIMPVTVTKPEAFRNVTGGEAVGGRVDFQNGIATGITTDGSTVNIIDSSFDVVAGKVAGQKLVTVVGGKPVVSTKPDASGVDAGGIPVGGSEFYNGKMIIIDTDIKGSGLYSSPIDSFEAYIDKDGDRRPVAIDAIKPVTSTKPESALPTQRGFGLDIELSFTKPESASQSRPMIDVYGISNLPDLKLQTESGDLHAMWENTKNHEWWAEMRAFDNEEVLRLRKKNEELATKGHQLLPEKAKPPVTGFGLTYDLDVEVSRRGDASKEAEESSTEYSELRSRKESEKYIADLLQSADETKSLPKKGQITITDCDFSDPAEGPADKKESDPLAAFPGASMREFGRSKMGLNLGYMSDRDLQDQGGLADKKESERLPILGDIPLVGGLFRIDGKKRSLTDEEKRRIVLHLKDGKSLPEGESEVTAIIPGSSLVLNYRIDEQSAVDRAAIPLREAEAELPPSSRFKLVPVNPWVMSERDSLSTFALDVDTASYALCRRYIRGGFLPPAGAVRMEEFVNYFNYQYPQRTNPTFKVHAEAAPSPFARKDQNLTLLKIGVKARTIGRDQRKAAHLIFVVDASASMGQPDRLPLVQQALDLLVSRLSEVDRVSLITCSNEARLHLESTSARERDRIRQAIYAIQPAGSTNLLAGLKLGYATARRSFAPKQINHVVLCSDGVANVGQTEAEAVLEEVAADRKQGITLTCVGVGYGSYNDIFLEALANRGDGSYVFLDSVLQAQRVFVEQLAATLQTVARDARIQVDFNPNRVRRYRLIGYENRDIEDKRFRDDTIDAGEVGSGQCSTALYELELIGQSSADKQGDLGTVFVRYRDVETGQIEEISSRLSSAIVRRRTVASAPRFFLAACAARFAEMLRQSEHAQHGNLMDVLRVVEQVSLALGLDRDVRELAELIRKAEHLPRSP